MHQNLKFLFHINYRNLTGYVGKIGRIKSPHLNFSTCINKPMDESENQLMDTKTLQRPVITTAHFNDHSLIKPHLWSDKLKRSGALGIKLGMITLFDEWGQAVPSTIVHIDDCRVLGTLPMHHNPNFIQLEMGIGRKCAKRAKPSVRGVFEKVGISVKRHVARFVVSPECALPPGWSMSAAHFVPGQCVHVKSVSVGKGFQGVMKRWGFKGLPKTHGVTKKHRSGGSIGMRQDPGRVFKNKKMAGKMGNDLKSTFNVRILKIDTSINCVYLKGSIAGCRNALVWMQDGLGKHVFKNTSYLPPTPTFLPSQHLSLITATGVKSNAENHTGDFIDRGKSKDDGLIPREIYAPSVREDPQKSTAEETKKTTKKK